MLDRYSVAVLVLFGAFLPTVPASAQTNSFGYTQGSTLPLDYVAPPGSETPLLGPFGGAMADDDEVPVTLPWAFPFYGNSHSTVYVGDNGGLRFNAGDIDYTNTCLPTSAGGGVFVGPDIAVYWDDLDVGAGGDIYAWEDAANGRFIISWENISIFSPVTPSDGGTFQIHMDATGNIEVHYLDLVFDGGSTTDDAASATVGMQLQVGVPGTLGLDPLGFSCSTAQPALEGSSVSWLLCNDSDIDGFSDISCGGTDCDDSNSAIYPGALEICDNTFDEDCNGSDLVGDFDNDMYDSVACVGGTDCDDTDPTINPGVNDDLDAFDVCLDCDDSSPTVYPGAPEICGNGIDEDCSGVDDGDNDLDTYFSIACGGTDCDDNDPLVNPGVDLDVDTYNACDDCDDNDPLVNPGAIEVCDQIDNDCDEIADFPDTDLDLFGGCDDCDDTDPTVYPGAPETCDSTDSDCDGLPDGQDADAGTTTGPGLAVTGLGNPVALPVTWGANAASTLDVSVLGDSIDDLDITFDIDVLINFQVEITLTSPAGTAVTLFSALQVAGPNFTDTTLSDEAATPIGSGVSPFTGTFSPVGALSAFDGENPNGTWTMEISEPSGIGGNLLGWYLTIELQTSDIDGDGWLDSCGDCDANDVGINPGATEICGDGIDQDCIAGDLAVDGDLDGFHDEACGGLDCDDSDPALNPGVDVDLDGYHACEDCDDGDPTISPGIVEVCDDGVDNDCDGVEDVADDDLDGAIDLACGGDDCDDNDPNLRPGVDLDGDGFDACEDCEDFDVDINPGAVEECDGLDNDCSGGIDDRDIDGDGFESPLCGVGTDCSDTNPNAYPGALEVCGDGVDQDCDGVDIDDDADGDGYVTLLCEGTDCNDSDPNTYPTAAEICSDGVDQDCDGLDEGEDDDGDTFFDAVCGGEDCDDEDAEVRPDIDLDGDGAHMCTDCDDEDPLRSPGSPEICDGLDNDCDESVDENIFRDRDGDGFDRADCGGPDCDDGDPLVHTDALELCGDAVDNDCNGDLDFDDVTCEATGCGSSVAATRLSPSSLLLLLLIPALRLSTRRSAPEFPR